MTGTETTDPVVAVFYGAGVHPSLRAGLEASTDLVAGQPGPWRLSDEDLAATCSAMVARLRPPVEVAVVAAGVVDHLEVARRGLFNLHASEVLPIHLVHFVEQLEHQLLKFTQEHGDQLRAIVARTSPEPAAAPAEQDEASEAEPMVFPSIDAAMGYRSADWRRVIAERDLSVPTVKAELAARCTAAGRTAPATLNDLRGRRDLAELMLHVISDLYRAANPLPGEGS